MIGVARARASETETRRELRLFILSSGGVDSCRGDIDRVVTRPLLSQLEGRVLGFLVSSRDITMAF